MASLKQSILSRPISNLVPEHWRRGYEPFKSGSCVFDMRITRAHRDLSRVD